MSKVLADLVTPPIKSPSDDSSVRLRSVRCSMSRTVGISLEEEKTALEPNFKEASSSVVERLVPPSSVMSRLLVPRFTI